VWVLWKIFLAEPNPLATATVCIVRQQQHGGDVWVMTGPALLGQSLGCIASCLYARYMTAHVPSETVSRR